MNNKRKKVEEFVKKRDEILAKDMSAETGRLSDAPKKPTNIDVWDNGDEDCGIIIDDDRYQMVREVQEVFYDMLSGNRLLTKQVEEMKLIINKHKIMSRPEIPKIIQGMP